MVDRLERRSLRRKIGAYTWALLLYYLLMNVCVTMVDEIALVYRGFQGVISGGSWSDYFTAVTDSMEEVLYSNGWGYLLSCALAVVLIWAWKGKSFFRAMLHTSRDMTPGAFGCLLCLFVSGQMVFQVVAVAEEWVLNHFGLSVIEAIEMASGGADTFSMFLYMALAAPVVEELVFRGLILRGLEPYGKRFAVVASAALFGLFHGNLVQTPYAFAVGLILGYTAVEYSIGWAMVLHMVNNLVLGDLFQRLTTSVDLELSSMILWGFILACTVASAVILLVRRREISGYHRANPISRSSARAFVTAVPNILFFLFMTFCAVSMLF